MFLAKSGQILGNFASMGEKTNFLTGHNVSANSRGKQERRKVYGSKYRKYNMVVNF